MLTGILFLFFSLTAFLIFTETVILNIFYFEDTKIFEFNFTLFAISFQKSEKSKNAATKSIKRKKKKHISKTLVKASISPMFFILKNCEINIRELYAFLPISDPFENHIKYGIYNSVFSSLYTLAEEKAKKFSSNNIIINYSEHNKLKLNLDMQIKISLFNIFISALIFVFENIKIALKKKKEVL